jgi:carboxylesterase type B
MQFAPVVDGDEIPMEVVAALQAGKFATNVAILEGANQEDGQTFVYGALSKAPLPVFLYEAAVDIVYAPYGDQIVKRYKNASIKDGRWLMGEVLTDYLFHCAMGQFSLAASKAGSPAYSYKYSHVFSASWIWDKFGLPSICANCTCHMAEVPFVFHSEVHAKDLNVTFTPAEAVLSDSIVDYWTSFARYGDPNKSGTQPFQWPAYTGASRKTLVIDQQMTVADYTELCTFWDKVGYTH